MRLGLLVLPCHRLLEKQSKKQLGPVLLYRLTWEPLGDGGASELGHGVTALS